MSRARDNANLSPTIPDARMPNLTGDVTTSEGAVATSITADAVGTDELANDVSISTSGNITTTGAFTSVGIDDNASGAVAITIDANENVGIGDTDPSEAKLSITGVASGDYGLKIDQDQDMAAIYIDSDGDENAMEMYAKMGIYAAVDISGGRAAFFDRNLGEAGTHPVVTIRDNHTSNEQPAFKIQEDGNAPHIELVGTGEGIKFNLGPDPQTAGTATGNTLNDYEEGTWTPTVATNTGTGTTYNSYTGRYIKIGNSVRVSCQARSNNGTLGPYFTITGVPFTAGANQDIAGSAIDTSGYQIAGSSVVYTTTLYVKLVSVQTQAYGVAVSVEYIVG